MDILQNIFKPFVEFLKSVLPLSPFRQFLSRFASIPHLDWLNWFVPVREILAVMSAWLVAVGLFYLYSVIMRWIKVIDG